MNEFRNALLGCPCGEVSREWFAGEACPRCGHRHTEDERAAVDILRRAAAPCERCAAIGKATPAAGSVADFNGTRRRVCDACHDAHVAALVLAERERCAKIAEAPREPTRGGGPADPQRIAAAIRALK